MTQRFRAVFKRSGEWRRLHVLQPKRRRERDLNETKMQSGLPGLLGIVRAGAGDGWVELELPLSDQHMAPNGYLHAGAVVSLADSACGVACARALPEGAAGFTTIELKSNFLSTALEGVIAARAEAEHLGRTTQIWSAKVTHKDNGKTIALFRCTQMVLWPKK